MSRPEDHLYEFAAFRLDAAERLLMRDGRSVPLTPKAFDTLLALVRRAGHLVEKDELMREVWPDSFVEEINLTVNISALRKILGEQKDARYIETVAKRGYRFIVPVKEVQTQETELLLARRTSASFSIKEVEEEIEDQPAKTQRRSEYSSFPSLGRRRVAALAFAMLLLGVVAAVSYSWISSRSKRSAAEAALRAPIHSIAVLPFKPIGPNNTDEYLELGMADALITKLSHIRQISIRPTSAIQRYATGTSDASAIGRELNVDAVLDGRMQRSGDRIRVTAQLVSVRDHASLWTDSFDEQYTNIFAVQDAIAGRVSRELAPVLSKQDQEQLKKRPTSNPEAYEDYLKGRYFWSKRTIEGTRKSVAYFKQAIEKDPNFALAYAGLADAYLIDNPAEAPSTLRKVMELDWTLGEAHASLGFNRLFWNWDWEGAEQEFKLAIELNPNYPTAHQWYGIYLAVRGRLDEAKAEMRKAIELDPLSPNMHADMGQIHYFAREYDEAITECRKALEIDPDFFPAHNYLFSVYAQTGMYDQAVEEFLKCNKISGLGPDVITSSRDAYAASGWRGFWLNQAKHWGTGAQKAFMYAHLGDKERAVQELEMAYASGDFFLTFIKVEPEYDELRSDPRFANLLRRMGLAG